MDDLFEPYERLIRLVVAGKELQVPENNLLLRQLSYVAPDISSGRYCWSGQVGVSCRCSPTWSGWCAAGW